MSLSGVRCQQPGRERRVFPAAFTLIELMVVVAIMGIILAAGVPSLFRALHKEGFRKTVSDIVEVCQSARSQAILHGTTTSVVFHPQTGTCEVSGGGKGAGGWGNWAQTAKLDNCSIDMLDINLREYKEAESASVRFFPNGTSDEMTLILRSDRNEQTGIVLEITTGLATVLSSEDLQRLQK